MKFTGKDTIKYSWRAAKGQSCALLEQEPPRCFCCGLKERPFLKHRLVAQWFHTSNGDSGPRYFCRRCIANPRVDCFTGEDIFPMRGLPRSLLQIRAVISEALFYTMATIKFCSYMLRTYLYIARHPIQYLEWRKLEL